LKVKEALLVTQVQYLDYVLAKLPKSVEDLGWVEVEVEVAVKVEV
jgi:hypothetical protein